MYESSKMKLSGCASNLLAHEDLGHLRKPIIGIYKSNSRDSLYEEHGATLKHKCGKRIVTLPLLSFSLFFIFFFYFFILGSLASFYFLSPKSHPDVRES